jgi:hypothetical protein
MYIAGRWADRQLSRLELIIAVIILSVVLTVIIQKMLKVFAYAERSVLNTSVININTAMQYRAAGYILRGDDRNIVEMQAINPFTVVDIAPVWLAPADAEPVPEAILVGALDIPVPGNYLGELDDPDPTELDGGQWYFDTADNTLVYMVDNPEYFYTSLPGPARIKLFVEIEFEDQNSNNRFDPAIDDYISIGLKATNDYEWRL